MTTLNDLLANSLDEATVAFDAFRGGGAAELTIADHLQIPPGVELPIPLPVGGSEIPLTATIQVSMHLTQDPASAAIADSGMTAERTGGPRGRRGLDERLGDVLGVRDSVTDGTAADAGAAPVAARATLRARVAAPVDIRAASPNSVTDAPSWIYVHVTATAAEASEQRTFGPYETVQAVVGLPIVALTFTQEGRNSGSEHPQLAYVMVHPSTPVDRDLDVLVRTLSAVATELGDLSATLGVALDLLGLSAITKLLESRAGGAIQVREKQWNLNDVDLKHEPWYASLNDIEAEDNASAVYVIAPPRTAVDFYTERDYDKGEGRFRITTGDAWLAAVPDLNQGLNPPVEFGSFDVLQKPDGPQHFNNRISSLAFV